MIMLILLEFGNAVPCSTRSDINLNRRHCYDRSLVIRDRNGSTVVETDMCQLAQAMKAEHAAKRPVTVHEYRGRRARTHAIPFSTLDSQMFVHTATCGCEWRQPRPTHIVCTGERPFLGVHSLSKSEQQHEAQTHTHTHTRVLVHVVSTISVTQHTRFTTSCWAHHVWSMTVMVVLNGDHLRTAVPDELDHRSIVSMT